MSDNDNRLIDILVGIAVGAFFIFLLFKTKQSEKQTLNSNIPNISPISISNSEELFEKIRKIERSIKILEDKSQIQYIQPQPQPPPQLVENKIYKNNEEWEICRDENGEIKKLRVIRNAKFEK